MPPLGSKGKSKGKDGRRSRSRNTTPSSVVSAPISAVASAAQTAYLEINTGYLMVPANLLYDDILERHGGSGGIPDVRHLEALENDLNTLSLLAQAREDACDGGMRELSSRRKERLEEDRELEQASRDAEEKASLKRAAEDDELERATKAGKLKKRKDRNTPREERPLTHGAHSVARQDGLAVTAKVPEASTPKSNKVHISPSKVKQPASGSSSSLSPPMHLQSPTTGDHAPAGSERASPVPSSASDDSHQPAPAASVPLFQTFGTNPLTFDDPTVYHIRQVMDSMTDDEKKEIYCVASFPHDDLSDLIAGTPPDKDFSNAKPSNQVNANTFAAYLDPYLRPLTEEDMAFLKERGDRVTPFLMPRRGKKHYTEVWADEDGTIAMDTSHGDRLPANQPRGALEQMDDDVAETEQISAGPLLSRLLSTMRPESRLAAEDGKDKANGDASLLALSNGDAGGEHGAADSIGDAPPATYFPESTTAAWKAPTAKLDYAAVDERLKAELRYLGFLGQDEEPDYDAHFDDEVAQRLRFLQTELKRQCIVNGARKARLLQVAQERMAYQEFATILEDLDGQVQQAYLKRNRSLGKGKKNVKRPGGPGGGSHYPGAPGSTAAGAASGAGTAGVAKPGIGDVARMLMERRRKWMDTITPVFSDDVMKVRSSADSIFADADMAAFLKAEREKWDEEAE